MSQLRKIEPLRLKDLAPAALDGRRPEFLWVDPRTLMVELSYQRDVATRSAKLIKRIVNGWDWTRFKPPVVAREATGRLYVIDGQHIAIAAATHGGIEKIPVMIVAAPEESARAAAFMGHNRDRLGMTPMQIHAASLVAGDEIAVALEAACRRAGARVCRTQPREWSVGDTVAIKSLRAVVTQKGPAGCARLMKCLVDAERAPITSTEIKAAAIVLFTAEPRIDGNTLAAAIRTFPADEWERRARRRREQLARPNMQPFEAVAMLWREEALRAGKAGA